MAVRKIKMSSHFVWGPSGLATSRPGKKKAKASYPAAVDADVDETFAAIVGARKLKSVHMNNTHNAVVWLQVFDTVTPTVGTTVPILSLPLAPGANNIAMPDDGVVITSGPGGIAIACTAGQSNNTAPGATVLGQVTFQ